ncbi:hypothetical protein EXIGLDRAFT_342951 [Exidia glandulosa HHB12029]|uniref:Uncharacterized protein n=1 Tax=Exidia glandulosa HHB12029 TaxID=1314781 RepID=A0A166B4P1_EXIGL|nr:hypothetical protein EXIGLDRAFT_342951 [Exidia glandulosa HHB12029]
MGSPCIMLFLGEVSNTLADIAHPVRYLKAVRYLSTTFGEAELLLAFSSSGPKLETLRSPGLIFLTRRDRRLFDLCVRQSASLVTFQASRKKKKKTSHLQVCPFMGV